MMESHPPELSLTPPRWLCFATLAAIFAVMLIWTWGGWPDPITDFGRELYVPWQLAQGKVLYRDIAYFNGPLSPYFNALTFKLFGPSLRTLELTNLALLAGLTAMLFALLSRVFDRLTALVGCIVQLTIFSFIQLAGIGNYNFVTPYSHELTHGLILSVGALLLMMRQLRPPSPCTRGEGGGEGLDFVETPSNQMPWGPSPQPSPRVQGEGGMFLAGFVLGLVFLTKIEVFFAAAGASVAFVVLRSIETQDDARVHSWDFQRFTKNLFQLALPACLPPLVAFVLLRCAMPTPDALHAVAGSFRYALDPRLTGNPFYQRILGTDALSTNAIHIGLMFGLDIAVLALIYTTIHFFGVPRLPLPVPGERAGERAFNSSARASSTGHRLAAIVCIGVAWLTAIIVFFTIDAQSWQSAFAALPILLFAIAGIQWFAAPKDGDSNRIPTMTFTIFAFLLLLKMFFAVRLSQYGFVLALPALLALISFLLSTAPALMTARGRDGRLLVQLCLPLIALIVAAHLRPYAQIFSHKPIAVGGGSDRFVVGDVRGAAVNQCIAALAKLPPDATVAVVPEGVMINYLARRANPTSYINLMPPEIIMFGQAAVLADFQAHPPDYIVLNESANPAEYGFASFADYAAALSAWIAANYESTNEPTTRAYPLRLLKHRREKTALQGL